MGTVHRNKHSPIVQGILHQLLLVLLQGQEDHFPGASKGTQVGLWVWWLQRCGDIFKHVVTGPLQGSGSEAGCEGAEGFAQGW